MTYASFIEEYTGKTMEPGNFVDLDGNVLGRHKGISHYTVGQRKGLNLAMGYPVFVVAIRRRQMKLYWEMARMYLQM